MLDSPARMQQYSFSITENGMLPVPLDVPAGPGLPQIANRISILNHGELVSAVIFSKCTRYFYTGGKYIKIWHRNSSRTISKIKCLQGNNHIRSMKLLPDGGTIIAGGIARHIFAWDIKYDTFRIKAEIPTGDLECFGVAVSPDSKMCFGSFSSGKIIAWDLHNHTMIAKLQGHSDDTTCIDISPEGTIWTGSLDKTVRSWDLRTGEQLVQHNFPLSISTLGFCPTEKWLVVGLEDSKLEVLHEAMSGRYQLTLHDSCVTSLKFANSGKWFVSTGKDKLLNCWKTPNTNIFQARESSSIISCDISADDNYIATGSKDNKVSVYRVMY